MMEIKNLQAGYRRRLVIKDLSATAQPGQLIALLGPNGSGKSTLLKTLCGIIPAEQGGVSYGADNLLALPAPRRARRIAYLSQQREAAPGMTVADIVALGRAPYRGRLGRISGAGLAAIKAACARAKVGPFLERSYDALSGGEQARVLLARALAVNAPILLLDEPAASLDPYYQLVLMGILKEEAAAGRIVIAALHDLALAHYYADHIWVMRAGELVANGTPQQIIESQTYADVFGVIPPPGGFPAMTLL